MLNGISPLLVITFKNKGIIDFFGGADSVLGSIVGAIGVPIPIYLKEELTGIYVQSESRGIDVTTRVDPVSTKSPIDGEVEPPVVSQTSRDSQLSIELVAKKTSILLVALIALMEMIVDRLVTQEYSIHYLNGPTAVFGVRLHRFATSTSNNDDLVHMELVLSTAAKESPTPKTPVESVPNTPSTSLNTPPAAI
jgi:hypothetical protein